METLEQIRRRIDTAEELESVVRTMKGIAAASIRRYEQAVAALQDYRRTVEQGLHALLLANPDRLAAPSAEPPERAGAIVFGSDQGFCGRFNQQLAAKAAEMVKGWNLKSDDRRILVVGTRIVPVLDEAEIETDDTLAPPSSAGHILALVQDALVRVQRWRAEEDVDAIHLVYNESRGGPQYEPVTEPLYPLDVEWLRGLARKDWPSRGWPIRGLPWRRLFSLLVRELLFVSLYRAAAQSLASENASRLASMQAAERNIDGRLGELDARFRLRRQSEITEELLDIVGGFEALGQDGGL